MADHPETMISERGRVLHRGVWPFTLTYGGASKIVLRARWSWSVKALARNSSRASIKLAVYIKLK